MSFLNPVALLALAAVTVPLFLHLFNLRQPRTVDFSSLDFVKELHASAVQRVRIKEWLLLALRMLAIASLVMAFARPTLTTDIGGVGASAPMTHALVLDNSLSMTADGAGGSYFDQAVETSAEVLSTVDENDEVLLWPTARSTSGRPQPLSTVAAARQAVSDVAPNAGASTLARSIVGAAEVASESETAHAVVYAVSDLQATTLGDSVATDVADDVDVQLIPVDTRTQTNVGVTEVTVTSRIAEVGQPVQIEATLVNHGPDPLADYVASVYLEGERVAQATATLEPGLETTVSFTLTPQARGWLAGGVVAGEDDLPVDDRHHFTLHVPEQRRILLVRGDGQDTNYVDLALSSEMTADRIAFETTAIAETALASTELGQYDTVLLVGPRTLSSGEVQSLTRYVNQGGGLLFFPNAQARADDYNALFEALGAGSFRGFSGALGGEQTVASFSRANLDHPLFEGVFQTSQSSENARIENPELYHVLNFHPSGRSGQTLIELSNGFPFLHEVRHGSGGLLLVAVAPTRAWSDLPVRGLFVPLLYRSVYYLSASTSVTGEQLVAGRPSELRVTGVSPDASLRLIGPDGVEVTPDQRTLFGAKLLQVGPTLAEPGIYAVNAGTTRVRRIAVNVDPAESNLETASPEEASTVLESATNARVHSVTTAENASLSETLQIRRSGTEIWNVFLLLALTFLVAEMLLASQWTPETVSS